MEGAEDLQVARETIANLRLQVESLNRSLQDLEFENVQLKAQLKRGSQKEVDHRSRADQVNKEAPIELDSLFLCDSPSEEHKYVINDQVTRKSRNNTDAMTQLIHHHKKRYVALKVMYFGQRFYGFASEAMMEPTVESEIFAALRKTKLLIGDKENAHYTRCGRTDKGVSAFGQVISLYLRSRCRGSRENSSNNTVVSIPDEEEIDYVRVLNRVLPSDIRVTGWCPVLPDFHSRFSCLSREYKYYFLKEDLDIKCMEVACGKFIGEHDFRNFCKMDARNVHNYKRCITEFEIVPLRERWAGSEVMAMRIKGSAFLWHQVRCMAAVLLMIGRRLETASIIDEMLDINVTIRKPQYTMASELPLVLQSSEFEGLSFHCSSDAAKDVNLHLSQQLRSHVLQAVIYHEASQQLTDSGGDIIKRKTHVPLSLRPTEPSYEERQQKLRAKSANLNGNPGT